MTNFQPVNGEITACKAMELQKSAKKSRTTQVVLKIFWQGWQVCENNPLFTK